MNDVAPWLKPYITKSGTVTPTQTPQAPQMPQVTLPPMTGFNSINPMYTRETPMNYFAPMQMLQSYRQTGQLPNNTPSGTAPAGGK